MDTKTMTEFVLELEEKDAANRISEKLAKRPEYTGRKIYDGALCGIAAADDDFIVSLKANAEANIDLMQPEEWLPGAKTVVSFFLPFARWITEENEGGDWPSDGWLDGRIEGQTAANEMSRALAEKIMEEGYEAMVPIFDTRFSIDISDFNSNWSERHVAYAAGLGTFGLSRGIITKLGMAGRFMSVITAMDLDPVPRPYKDLYEYCIKCGTCIENCPVGAISVEHLKNNAMCSAFLDETKLKEAPFYGCGKCQCAVPCAFGIPTK